MSKVLKNKLLAILIGFILGSAYGGIAWFTTLFKGTGLDMLFITSGMILAPVGAAILWIIESLGLVSDPSMGGGVLIFALGGYVLWVNIFIFISLIVIKKYTTGKSH